MQHLVSSGNGRDLKNLLSGFLAAPSISTDLRLSTWTMFLQTTIQSSSFELLRDMLDSVQFSLPQPIDQQELYDVCKSWAADIVQGAEEHLPELLSILGHWGMLYSQRL
jgi:hypothetical protein